MEVVMDELSGKIEENEQLHIQIFDFKTTMKDLQRALDGEKKKVLKIQDECTKLMEQMERLKESNISITR